MSQTGVEITITNRQVSDIYGSLTFIGNTENLPHDLSYAGVRNVPRLKQQFEEISNAERELTNKHGKRNEDGMVMATRMGNPVFKNVEAEDAWVAAHKKLLDEEYTFTAYLCDEKVIDEMKGSDYKGGYGFLSPLLDVIVGNVAEMTANATEATRLKKEAEMSNGDGDKKKAVKGK